MKALLTAALALSLAFNVWLLLRRGEGAEEPHPQPRQPSEPISPARKSAADARSAARSGGTELEALSARIAELEKDLAVAKQSAADLASLDPLALLVHSRKPIGWKVRRLLDIASEKDRAAALKKVADAMSEKEGSAREILDALRTETDPRVLATIGDLLRGGAASRAAPDDRRAFAEMLRNAASPELRAACVGGVFTKDAFRTNLDEAAKALAAEMNGALVDALRTDSSADVVGAIARSMGDVMPQPEAMDALKGAAGRLPPGAGRRSVWEAFARGSFIADHGVGTLVQQFQQATAQDVRDDIGAGLARAGNSWSAPFGDKPDEARKKADEARERVKSVFGSVSDPAVRRALTRASLFGLGCVPAGLPADEEKAGSSRFLHQLASLETDLAQRERLERLASAFEEKGRAAAQDYERIMSR